MVTPAKTKVGCRVFSRTIVARVPGLCRGQLRRSPPTERRRRGRTRSVRALRVPLDSGLSKSNYGNCGATGWRFLLTCSAIEVYQSHPGWCDGAEDTDRAARCPPPPGLGPGRSAVEAAEQTLEQAGHLRFRLRLCLPDGELLHMETLGVIDLVEGVSSATRIEFDLSIARSKLL